MKSICFHCLYVGVGAAEPSCPQCGHALIQNMGGAALGARDLEKLFARAREGEVRPMPLPGISAEPRQAQLLMARRKERMAQMAEARRRQEAAVVSAQHRRRLAGAFAAASAVALGLILTLNVVGAL